jgi:hypothetical protein
LSGTPLSNSDGQHCLIILYICSCARCSSLQRSLLRLAFGAISLPSYQSKRVTKLRTRSVAKGGNADACYGWQLGLSGSTWWQLFFGRGAVCASSTSVRRRATWRERNFLRARFWIRRKCEKQSRTSRRFTTSPRCRACGHRECKISIPSTALARKR